MLSLHRLLPLMVAGLGTMCPNESEFFRWELTPALMACDSIPDHPRESSCEIDSRGRILDLGGTWRFMPDPHADGEELGFWRRDHSEELWRDAPVPSVFEAANPRLDCYQGIVWYRRSFRMPAGWNRQRVVLRFEAVNYVARVWLNGTFLGENRDGFLPFEFHVDHLLSDDGENVLAVSVDNAPHDGDVPGTHVQWRGFGGILREVTLRSTEATHIERLEIDATPGDHAGQVVVRAVVRRALAAENAADKVRATIAVFDHAGKRVLELVAATHIALGASGELLARGQVPAAELWSPDSPRLYRAVATLGGGTDTAEARFGFRRIRATPQGLLLNERPVFLLGFNRHEDSPTTAMAIDRRTTREDLVRIKDTGANFVRLCHYPHHSYELDLCDELGLLVMDEIPLNLDVDPARATTAERMLRRLIQRDRNHPSVIFWSAGNETNEEDAFTAEANRRLVHLARQLDPSRLCVHVSYRWKQNPNFEADDVICINNYPSIHGWKGRRGSSPAADLRDSAETWRRQLMKLRERFPDKPILVTEFGYCSIGGTYGHALGEDMHERVIRAEFPVLSAPLVCGASCWCWADHMWPPGRTLDGMGMSPFGVTTRDRKPKRALAAIRELYHQRRTTMGLAP